MSVITEIPGMDPVFMAFSLFRRHRYPKIISDVISKIIYIFLDMRNAWNLAPSCWIRILMTSRSGL